ncbi:MAG: ribosomal L7Ae/L30e/S12e/Gadd45 family protein [Candidatus Aenigmatarchaeota archaeon]
MREAVSARKALLGSRSVLRAVRMGSVKSVIIATNCPAPVAADIQKYAKMAGITVEQFDGTGKQLGTLCGKPFSIAVAAIRG